MNKGNSQINKNLILVPILCVTTSKLRHNVGWVSDSVTRQAFEDDGLRYRSSILRY